MKKFNSSLLLITALTGLFLTGCNQKPATQSNATKGTTGSITIQDASSAQNANGSISIETPSVTTTTDDAAARKATITVQSVTSEGTVTSADQALDDTVQKVPVTVKSVTSDGTDQASQALKDAAAAQAAATAAAAAAAAAASSAGAISQ